MLSIRLITRSAIVICCVIALAAPLHAQTILRVDGDQGSATGDGSDWGPLAYKFPQDALARALQLEPTPENPVELWVAKTDPDNPYRPDQDAANPTGTAARTATFNLINNVEIYGGFLGTDHPVAPETLLSQRDPENNETVLSGDLLGDDNPNPGDIFVNYDDNSFHVVRAFDVDNTAWINGFTVTAGNATGSGPLMQATGGLSCEQRFG